MRSGLRLRPDVTRALVDGWNTGLDDAPERSEYTGPVLIVRGAGDGFVSEELVATAIAPRFPAAESVVIEGAGHWPHLEQPAALAAHLDRFVSAHRGGPTVGRRRSPTSRRRPSATRSRMTSCLRRACSRVRSKAASTSCG